MTSAVPTAKARAHETRSVRLNAKAADPGSIVFAIEHSPLARGPDEVILEIAAAGVNQSDVKAALGLMPHAVFPRTPGRDYAGIVVEGPPQWLGREVFGSSGDLGMRRNGSHATHVVVETAALVPKPRFMSMNEAAGIGVPFVTAIEGYRRAGMPTGQDNVVVMGLNGKVGQAAAQLAAWHGANVIGVVRNDEPYQGHASRAIKVINAAADDVAARVRELTDGKGADIVFNTVGDPYFQAAHQSLAQGGRHILIAAVDRIVQFNIFEFYRGRHTYVGVDTLALSSIACGALLREALPGFESGHLKPFPISGQAIYPLSEAKAAYLAALGSRDRIILSPAA
jgi:NADPH2:quinone reductase